MSTVDRGLLSSDSSVHGRRNRLRYAAGPIIFSTSPVGNLAGKPGLIHTVVIEKEIEEPITNETDVANVNVQSAVSKKFVPGSPKMIISELIERGDRKSVVLYHSGVPQLAHSVIILACQVVNTLQLLK